MAVDGKGRFIFNNILDEKGLRIFVGNFNEFGHYAKSRKEVELILTETIAIISFIKQKAATHYLGESITITSNFLSGLYRTLQEFVHIETSKHTSATHFIATSILLSVGRTIELKRILTQPVTIAANFQKRFYIYLNESITIADTIVKGATHTLHEAITTTVNKGITTATHYITQGITIYDKPFHEKFFLYLTENFHVATSIHKTVTRTLTDYLTINAWYAPPFFMKYLHTKLQSVYKAATLTATDKHGRVRDHLPSKFRILKNNTSADRVVNSQLRENDLPSTVHPIANTEVNEIDKPTRATKRNFVIRILSKNTRVEEDNQTEIKTSSGSDVR